MQTLKKQLEILLLHYFRQCYPDFPKGKVIPSESPDFIISLKSKNNIGVELTRLNPLNAKVPDQNELAQRKVNEHITQTAKQLFKNTSPFPLFVKFLFSEKYLVKKESALVVAAQTANIIRKAVRNRNREDYFHVLLNSGNLPRGIDEILLAGHPQLKYSIWERSNNLGISKNVIADIHESIKKKDEKLNLYQKQRLNFYWLLITTDRVRGVKNINLTEKINNLRFKSRFQHVFLLDLIKSSVFQLV